VAPSLIGKWRTLNKIIFQLCCGFKSLRNHFKNVDGLHKITKYWIILLIWSTVKV